MKKSIIARYAFTLCIAASMAVSGSAIPYCSILPDSEVSAQSTAAQGSCGPDVTYSISDDGVMTISGTGPMYTDMSSSLWDRSSVKSVVIESGVTLIGSFAFAHNDNLVSVTIPDTVKTISNGAFMDCASLAGITIPDSVTSMGSQCFSLCKGLKSVKIGTGLTTIPSIAFSYCSALTEVDLGAEILCIENEAFSNCTSLGTIVLKSKVKTISDKAFYMCWSLKSITIPQTVTSIGKDALLYCGTGEPGPDNKLLYGFTAYTVKDSYAAQYVSSLSNPPVSTDPPEEISAFEYYDIVCIALGNDIYYQIVDSKDYVPFSEVNTYYIPGLEYKCGDIYGIKLNSDNVVTSYSVSPLIKQNSSFKADSLYTIKEPVYADAKGSYIFGTVDTVYSDTCIQVSTDAERLLVICDSTKGLSQGNTVSFTPYEVISGNNMSIYTTKNLEQTYNASGTCLGYSTELHCNLFLDTSGNYDQIPMNNAGFFFVAGDEIPVGQTTVSVNFNKPENFINEIPVISLYSKSIAPGSEVITAVDDPSSQAREGMLSVKYTDNGGLVYLDENTSVYLLNGIPADAQPGDYLSFRLLNKIGKDACYAADVRLTGKTALPTEIGDINKDKKVNILDLILLKSYIVNDKAEKVDSVCDVNQDTYFSVLDIVALVKILLGQ
ncbi:MAG: leucine-rich repeat protein [Oscillospiraceae bacterium]|nr:leucine-rich repeat protein [Oscillospiraceae bacterium]